MKFYYHNKLIHLAKAFKNEFNICDSISKFKKNEYAEHKFIPYKYVSVHQIDGQRTTTEQNGIKVCCIRGCYKQRILNCDVQESNDFKVNDKFYFWNMKEMCEAYYCHIAYNNGNTIPIKHVKHGKFCQILKKNLFSKEKRTLFYWNSGILI